MAARLAHQVEERFGRPVRVIEVAPLLVAQLRVVAREVFDADDSGVGAVARDRLGHQHRVAVVLGEGQHLPAVVDTLDEAPLQRGILGGRETAQRRGVGAVAGDLLGKELVAEGEHMEGLVGVVDLAVTRLLFLDPEALAQDRAPALVRAQALQQIGHRLPVEVDQAPAGGALDGEVADGLAEVAVHQGLFLEQRRLEAVGGEVSCPHGDGLAAVGRSRRSGRASGAWRRAD